MTELLQLLSYGLVAYFGVFLSADFSGVTLRKRALYQLLIFTAGSLVIQLICFRLWGFRVTQGIYPLLLHLPLVLFLALGFQKPWPVAAASVLFAYLCCQIPRWIASFTYLLSEDPLYYHILYISAIAATYVILHLRTAGPVQKVMTYSPQSALGLGLLPLLYYIFDYLTTVYTDLLYSGNIYVAQIMPSIMAIGYILFVLTYQSRLEEQETAQQERYLLSLQLRRSQAEYGALCELQEQATRYHHDLRHHASLLMEYAEQGSLPQIKAYLQDLQQHLDVSGLKRFCGHQVIDLLLSHFENQAQKAGVQLSVTVELPQTLPFKDTELCSLLSNGLENAIRAASQVPREKDRVVTVSLSLRQRNLLLSIQNPYKGSVTIVNGLPVSKRPGHGLGTRSILSIVKQYDGLVHFSAADGIFLLRASLPMRE